MKRILLLTAFIATVSRAQDLSQFEKVLIPVYAPIPIVGVGGSSFAAQTAAYSAGPCTYFPALGADGSGVLTTSNGDFDVVLAGSLSTAPQARFLLVDKNCAAARFLTTVSSFSSAHQSGLVHIPVARQDDFSSVTLQLLGIPNIVEGGDCVFGGCPLMPRYRHRVRIFNAANDPTGIVKVNYWVSPVGGAPDGTHTVTLNRLDGTDGSFPFYGEVDVENVCLVQKPGPCIAVPSARIEIVPQSPGLRYWAFASSTDNVTQQVLISTP